MISGVRQEFSSELILNILDIPNPSDSLKEVSMELKKNLVNCCIKMDYELNSWVLAFNFSKPNISLCKQLLHNEIKFTYDCQPGVNDNKETYLADQILSDWEMLVKMFRHAQNIDDILNGKYESKVVRKNHCD